MKLLLTSDWHGDALTGGYRRGSDIEKAARATVDYAVDNQIDWWIFLGDLCDPDNGSSTLYGVEISLAIANELAKASIWNAWIAGNHDVIEDGSGRTTLTPLRRADLIFNTVFERPEATLRLGPGVLLQPLPYVSRTTAYDPDLMVRKLRTTAGDDDLVVFGGHLQSAGAKLGSETHDMPRGRDVAWPMEAVKLFPKRRCYGGHYHQRQKVGELTIVGSLERLSFGEESNRPGFMVVEI